MSVQEHFCSLSCCFKSVGLIYVIDMRRYVLTAVGKRENVLRTLQGAQVLNHSGFEAPVTASGGENLERP